MKSEDFEIRIPFLGVGDPLTFTARDAYPLVGQTIQWDSYYQLFKSDTSLLTYEELHAITEILSVTYPY